MFQFLCSLLAFLMFVGDSYALTFIARGDYDNSSSATATVPVPAGTADNDLLLTFCRRSANTDPTTVPTGWALVNSTAIAAAGGYWLYWKIASSEPASYDWVWGAAARNGCTMVAYRNDFNTTTPIDQSSSVQYTTNDTTMRAGGITVTAANSVLLYFGGTTFSTSQTLSNTPSVPASGITWAADVDDRWDSGSRFLRSIFSGSWTSSGATGTSDITISTAVIDKHAFLVSLTPAAGGGGSSGPNTGSLTMIGVGK